MSQNQPFNHSMLESIQKSLVEIIRKASAELPDDVFKAVQAGQKKEADQSSAKYAMNIICDNVDLAKKKSQPLCQDTGTVTFYIQFPMTFELEALREVVEKAVVVATEKGYLRQNSVDSITGKNAGNNLGPGAPVIYAEPWKKNEFDVRLILKGGGCENVGAQYSLPDGRVGAGRDLKGVKKCVLDAIHQAQGKGCGPGILGVCIGGDRASGYSTAKKQFLRVLADSSDHPDLAKMEKEITEEANQLGIGPMGFGGKTTLLGTKMTHLNRVPASFFVSISYMCWAFRRQGAELSPTGEIQKWIY